MAFYFTTNCEVKAFLLKYVLILLIFRNYTSCQVPLFPLHLPYINSKYILRNLIALDGHWGKVNLTKHVIYHKLTSKV